MLGMSVKFEENYTWSFTLTKQRAYPLLIGCGEFDIPMELEAVKMWKDREPQCKVVVFESKKSRTPEISKTAGLSNITQHSL